MHTCTPHTHTHTHTARFTICCADLRYPHPPVCTQGKTSLLGGLAPNRGMPNGSHGCSSYRPAATSAAKENTQTHREARVSFWAMRKDAEKHDCFVD